MVEIPKNFDDQTYVAYSDLCGYKQMAEKNRKRALKALDRLFDSTADLQNDGSKLLGTGIHAIVVSDCVTGTIP